MLQIKKDSLNRLGQELIDLINSRKDFFRTFTVIVPGLKTEQWFRTFWLKGQDGVLMNVSFKRIDEALLDILETDGEWRLIPKDVLKMLIMKHLSKNSVGTLPNDIKSYYSKNGETDAIKLYDISDRLSQLFVEYDLENTDITGWEKELYDKVLSEAEKVGLGTLRSIFAKSTGFRTGRCLYFFGFAGYTGIQEKIINEYAKNNTVMRFDLKEGPSEGTPLPVGTITAAPSRLREVEAVHGKICSLLKNDDVKYSDFLVLAPDICSYETDIARVFRQDGVSFPDIPYSVNDRKKADTDVVTGLKKLAEIFGKKFFTRLDFSELINNRDIQYVRGITREDVDAFTDAVISMNIHRQHEGKDDWKYAKNRLLTAKISDINDTDGNTVIFSGEEYLPYASSDLDDPAVIKFVKLIDDLYSWIELSDSISTVNNDNIPEIEAELAKWFSVPGKDGDERSYHYKKISDILEIWKALEISDDTIPVGALFSTLFEAGQVIHSNCGDFFVKGITFSDFDEAQVVSARYVFFMDAGSSKFPEVTVKSELDERTDPVAEKKKRTEDAFMVQHGNCDEFHVSFVNRDLKTDEEYFVSPLVLNTLHLKKEDVVKIDLDEKRNWKELYTKKEYKNRDYYKGLLSGNEDTAPDESDSNSPVPEPNQEKMKTVRVRDMADFLEDSLKYKYYHLFSRNDSTDEKTRDEYEPFNADSLTQYKIIKFILTEELGNKKAINDKDLRNRLSLTHSLPEINDFFSRNAFDLVRAEASAVEDLIDEKTNGSYDILAFNDMSFGKGFDRWTLTCNEAVCRAVDGATGERIYLQLKKAPNNINSSNIKEFLYLYAASLMDVASLKADCTYSIRLIRASDFERSFSVTPAEAHELLEKIYDAMNDYSKNPFMHISIISDSKIETLDALSAKISSRSGLWDYFDGKKMFDTDSQIGYSRDNFKDEFKAAQEEAGELILFIDKEKTDDSAKDK